MDPLIQPSRCLEKALQLFRGLPAAPRCLGLVIRGFSPLPTGAGLPVGVNTETASLLRGGFFVVSSPEPQPTGQGVTTLQPQARGRGCPQSRNPQPFSAYTPFRTDAALADRKG